MSLSNIKIKYYFILNEECINTKIFDIEDIEGNNFNTLLFKDVEITKQNYKNMLLIRKQCTDRKDRNNIEIYDGDIIELYLDNQFISDYVCEFKDGCFMFREIGSDWIGTITKTDIEVIGNIYENPELLENTK